VKFWLTCFVLLFAGAELFQWMVALGGADLSGAWLVLGGMGLAAASNAKHLPRLSPPQVSGGTSGQGNDLPSPSTVKGEPTRQQQIAHKDNAKTTAAATRPESQETDSDKDSISFKVRLPWR